MIKKIFLGLSLLIGTTTLAQQSTASPYSYYGLGDTNFGGTNEYKAMGGVSTYSDSIHINLQNPASFSKLKFTSFTVGLTNRMSKFEEKNNISKKTNKTSIDYLAIGLPLGKFGASFGLLPFSTKGYSSNSIENKNGMELTKEFIGSGGLNKAFIGFSYSILPNLQIGADVTYSFGTTNKSSTAFITNDGTDFSIPKGSRERHETRYGGATFNTGLIYTQKIKNYEWHNSISYAPQAEIKGDSKVFLETVISTPSKNLIPSETTQIDNFNKYIISPSKFTIGSGIGKSQKWFVGAEFTHIHSSKLNKSFNNYENANFENSNKFSIGGFYIPKHNSFTSYLDRVVYRGGLRYENTGLVINNNSIDDKALSIGAGFPIYNGLTNININLELGQKGIKTKTLIRENYINISIGFSLNDSWFNVRRFE